MTLFPLILALTSAFFVGTADFLSRFSSQRRNVLYPILWVMAGGTFILGVHLILEGHDFTLQPLWLYGVTALAGGFNVLALLSLYTALRIGPVAIASPLCSLAAVFLGLEWFVMGVYPSSMAYYGIFCAIMGAMIVSFFGKSNPLHYTRQDVLNTIFLSLACAVFFSLRLFLLQYYQDDLGVMNGLFQVRCFGLAICVLLALYYSLKGRSVIPDYRSLSFKYDIIFPFIQSLLETFGILFLLMASVGEFRVTAPAIFSCFSAVTVLWSVLVFKEKIGIGRMIGIGVLIAGIVIIQVGTKVA